MTGFSVSEDYTSRNSFRNPVVPQRDRNRHGQHLATQYDSIIRSYQESYDPEVQTITEEVGIYVQITSFPEVKLPLASLDTRDFKLYSCQIGHENNEVAVVFIPESRRSSFQQKLNLYLNSEKDSIKGVPRNHNLLGSISEIRLADLRSFWTDDPNKYPQNQNDVVWWELWLKDLGDDDPRDIARSLAEQIGGRLGNTSQSYFGSYVTLIRASAVQLEGSLSLISNLEELRRAKETPNVFLDSSPKEQGQWINDLASRINIKNNINTAVCILDAGVNYNHPLLALASDQELSESWNPNWPFYDTYNPLGIFNDHGSKQAGLALLGNIQDCLISDQRIQVNHLIESARILPPLGANDPELYGAITIGTAAKVEAERSHWNRVYSLAITSQNDSVGGQPSTWSSEIDLSASGLGMSDLQRLYVISAGNNENINSLTNYWDQIHLAEIEDPAQSWNALTIGAYTELTTNDDPDFNGWTPMAETGDASPATRSAVNWGWNRHAPIKPELVAEGGNRLVSPDQTEVSNADVVSLLTTSGRTTGALFETSGDTSSATAIISHQAAILMNEYPEYWPETIRGLLVHSADWTPRMYERFGLLNATHTLQVAKKTLLRTVGYGVPNIERAKFSADHALTLIEQNTIQPFYKDQDASDSADPKLNEMKLYQLPLPVDALQQLPPETEVKLKITLSYFIEPNPSRRGFRQRYSYQSHGLRFQVIRPGQSLDNFKSYVNASSINEEYNGPEGNNEGWFFGHQLRTRGSLHSDFWIGTAADLADMNTIAIYPVGGWWKYHTAEDRWQSSVRYSLLVSIEVPDENVDIYSVIENQIQTVIEV